MTAPSLVLMPTDSEFAVLLKVRLDPAPVIWDASEPTVLAPISDTEPTDTIERPSASIAPMPVTPPTAFSVTMPRLAARLPLSV
ncbi:MAG: hypothetical protein ACRD9W_26445, partial [Terriglobia bacterium]